jgi:hypothetical protein
LSCALVESIVSARRKAQGQRTSIMIQMERVNSNIRVNSHYAAGATGLESTKCNNNAQGESLTAQAVHKVGMQFEDIILSTKSQLNKF